MLYSFTAALGCFLYELLIGGHNMTMISDFRSIDQGKKKNRRSLTP